LRASLFNSTSYAFNVELQVTYEISNDGLKIQLEVANHEAESVPFAVGIHPYFVTDSDSKLEVFASRFITKNDRGLPVGQIDLSESKVIHSGSNLVADLDIDDCITGLTPDDLHRYESTISRDLHNLKVALSQSNNLNHLMIFRFDQANQGSRTLIALEPQSAPANALRNEPSNHLLAAGETKVYDCNITARSIA
jgi:aldose 1-epimerase